MLYYLFGQLYLSGGGRVMSTYLRKEELDALGFKSLGQDVLISSKASIHAPELISVGDHVRIDDFAFLSGEISLGRFVHIAPFCGLVGGAGGAGIVMEDYSGLSSHVMIYSISDDYSGDYMTNPTIPAEFTSVRKGKVVLQRFVIVGASSVILPGVEIGEGTAVGAMSLIARSLPDWKICSGIPARALKDRNKGIQALERRFSEKALKAGI